MHLLSGRPVAVVALAFSLTGLCLQAASGTDVAKPLLQVDDIFAREPLIGRTPASITWAPNGSRFLYTLPGGESGPLDTHLYDVGSRRERIFFRAAAEGKGSRPAPEFVWAPDSRRLAYLDAGDLWVINADGTGRKRLAAEVDDPQWSPDSKRIAYVHANDIYASGLQGGSAQRYSRDGSPQTVNGDPDWVYSEELDMHHAFSWSPDGKQIAYLRFDQRPIAAFPIVDFLAPGNTVEQQHYPLAGQPNSVVTLRVASATGAPRQLYTTKLADDYLASVSWTPAGQVAAQILDRPQKHLRYVTFDGTRSIVRTSERDAKWVDLHPAPVWLRDKRRFLFVSDRAGQSALFIADGAGQVKRLTRDYVVTALAGVDESRGLAFVAAAYPTRRDSTLLAIPFSGGGPRPLATGDGTHAFALAPNGRNFVRTDSAFGVPPVYTIGSTLGGGLIPFVSTASLANRNFGTFELMQIDSRFGKLDAWMIKPPNFNPAKQYPVVTYVYGGPAAPTTANSWGGQTYLFHQALAQRGFIVFSVDGPGSQIDSAAAVRRMYHRLGPASLAGQLAGVAYLQSQPFVDPERLGIWGWSFGGYETTYALTHSPGTWKVGEAVAPVTDWRYYDTIYTERYMGTPLADPGAYHESSAVDGAAAFAGRMLISHGTADDNVHLANSVALLQALLLSGKQVDYMVYPRKTHSIAGIAQRRHLFTHMLEYWQEHL